MPPQCFPNDGGELFVQLVAPGVEESAHFVRVGVVPKLLELLAQKIGDVQARVGLAEGVPSCAGRRSGFLWTAASSVRIWSSMMLVSGQAAEVSVIVMTAVRPSTSTRRTKPRSTMLTPRSGSMTSGRASRTAAASCRSAGRGAAARTAPGTAPAGSPAAGALPAGTPAARAARMFFFLRTTDRRHPSRRWHAAPRAATSSPPGTWGWRSSPRCRAPCGGPGRCPRRPRRGPPTRMSRAGLSPACSARTMTRSSSRATGSQVRPGPNRSRAWARHRVQAQDGPQRRPPVRLGQADLRLLDPQLGGQRPRLAHRPMSTQIVPSSSTLQPKTVSRALSGLMPQPVSASNSHRCRAQISVSPSKSPSSSGPAWCGQVLA